MNKALGVIRKLNLDPSDFNYFHANGQRWERNFVQDKVNERMRQELERREHHYDHDTAQLHISDQAYKELHNDLFKPKTPLINRLIALFCLPRFINSPINSKRSFDTLKAIHGSKGQNMPLKYIDYNSEQINETINRFFCYRPKIKTLRIDENMADCLQDSMTRAPEHLLLLWAKEFKNLIKADDVLSDGIIGIFQALSKGTTQLLLDHPQVKQILFVPPKLLNHK